MGKEKKSEKSRRKNRWREGREKKENVRVRKEIWEQRWGGER